MKVLTAGTATMDIIVTVSDDGVERMTLHNQTLSFLLLEQGQKIEAESVTQHIGGGAVNAGICLTKLGHQVSVFGKVGRDANGATLLQSLAASGLDIRYVRLSDTAPTAVAVNVSSHDRNASIFIHRGANTEMTEEEIPAAALNDFDLVLLGNLSGGSSDLFPVLLEKLADSKALVACNPGRRQLASRSRPFIDSLSRIDVLALNWTEAQILAEFLPIERYSRQAQDWPVPAAGFRTALAVGDAVVRLSDFLAELHRRGPKTILLTLGLEGSLASTGTEVSYCPAMPVQPMGTAGAGDAFIATFVSEWARNHDLARAQKLAAINAASVVSFVDTQSGLMGLADLEARAADWKVSAVPVELAQTLTE